MISFALEDEQQLVKETARKFARDVLRPAQRAAEEAGVSPEVERAFVDLGLCHLDLEGPGTGASGLLAAALIHEELAWGDPGAAVALWTPHSAAHALFELASPEQRERLLPILASPAGPTGPGRGAVAFSERGRPRPAGFATTATPTPGGYLLSGTKCFVVNAGLNDLTLVFAQVDPDAGWDGIGAFAVTGRPTEAGTHQPGERHHLLGLGAVTAGELRFTGHFVAESDRLRGGGDLLAATRRFFARCQLVGAARQVGLARAAYEFALEYTQDRRAFGKPVAHFQAIAFTLADMLMDVESARWLVWRAAAAADKAEGRPDPRLCAEAALHANEGAWRVAEQCVQLLGGAGFIQDFPAEKWLREAKALGLLAGSAELLQQIIAAEQLGAPGPDPLVPAPALQPVLT